MQTQESPTSALVLCSDLIVFTTWSLLLPLRARRPQSAPECDGSDKNIANCIRRLVETHKWAAVAVELASIVPNCPQSLAVSDAPLFTTYWIGQRQKRWAPCVLCCVLLHSYKIAAKAMPSWRTTAAEPRFVKQQASYSSEILNRFRSSCLFVPCSVGVRECSACYSSLCCTRREEMWSHIVRQQTYIHTCIAYLELVFVFCCGSHDNSLPLFPESVTMALLRGETSP